MRLLFEGGDNNTHVDDWYGYYARAASDRGNTVTIFYFSKFVFLAFIKLSGNRRTYLYSGGSGLSVDIHFVGFNLSFHALSPLPIVLSKHFNHPHP